MRSLIVEAATETLDLKLRILRQVDELAARGRGARVEHVVDLDHRARGGDARSARFLGMHFFNPVPMMALVEVIRGLQTSEATIDDRARFRRAGSARRRSW